LTKTLYQKTKLKFSGYNAVIFNYRGFETLGMNMIVAGIDIGSRSSQTVILMEGGNLVYSNIETGPDSVETARQSMNEALCRMELPDMNLDKLDYIVATGYGRVIVPFANDNISEISCHARGAHAVFPSTRTILDMGGQDCKAIRCDESGRIADFVMNDKCAGGTGRFFEIIAEVLGIPLEDIGPLSLKAAGGLTFNTRCAIFAKSNAMALLRQHVDKKEILAGLHDAVARRVINLLNTVGIVSGLAVTGGIAKNIGLVKSLERKLEMDLLIPDEPQIMGALGAALFARDCVQERIRSQPTAREAYRPEQVTVSDLTSPYRGEI
jgi:predicted CoA-substrate-specific enzyme activase